MDYFNDLISVYKNAGRETLEILKKNPVLIFMPLIYSLVYGLINLFSFRLGFGFSRFWGLIIGLIEAMLLSSYFVQLETGINYNRLHLKSIKDSFFAYIWPIYFMRFVFYIFSMFFGRIVNSYIISIVSFILFNAAGEAIYLKRVDGINTFIYPLNYLKDNWYLWLPTAAIYIFLLSGQKMGVSMNPLNMYLYSIGLYIDKKILLAILGGVYFVFRGVLFKNTHNSTIRKRKYMGLF